MRGPLRAVAATSVASALALLLVSSAMVPPPRPAQPPPATQPGETPAPPVIRPPSRPGAPAPIAANAEPDIDVGLAWDLDSLTIFPDGAVGIRSGNTDQYGVTAASGPLYLRPEGVGFVVLAYPDTTRRVWRARQGEWLAIGGQSLRVPSPRPLGWNGKHWRGRRCA